MRSTEIRAKRRSRWALVLRGLFALAAGLYIVARPFASVAVLALVLAVWLLVDGVVHIVHAFDLRGWVPRWWVMLLNGIIGVMLGVGGLYFYPELSIVFAVIWVSFWLFASGIVGVLVAIDARREHLSWAPMMAFGLLSITVAALAFFDGAITIAVLTTLLAVFGVVGGIALLVAAFRTRSAPADRELPLEYTPGLRRSS